MRRLVRLRDLAGWLAVALMLALMSPGVRAIRADTAARHALAAGPSCEPAGAPGTELPRVVRVDLSRLAARPEAARVEALNTEGYRYGAQPEADAKGPAVHVILEPLD
jgi:hypothetical protein